MENVYVALLRGINLGAANRIAMKDLAPVFSDLGCREVRTYIQSGNVIFRAGDALAAKIEDAAQGAIVARFGLDVPVVVRSAGDLRRVAASNPFLERGEDPKSLHVLFLKERPADSDVASLDPGRSPGDEFAVVGREVYLFCPNGIARSKLTNEYVDARLKTRSTSRNWNTLLKLIELASEGALG